MKKRNFILVSGGPGPFDTRDPEHDQGWANYVTPVLLMTDGRGIHKNVVQADEDVWWFIYKPAYERRWNEDVSSSHPDRKQAINDVRNKGFSSYVEFLEARAKSRGWNLRWLSNSKEFWQKLATFRDPISRLWYWGHARNDIWLSLRHASNGAPVSPEEEAIIRIEQIAKNSHLQNSFQPGSRTRIHHFVGCNTSAFAQHWAETFNVFAEGFVGIISFKPIFETDGVIGLSEGARQILHEPKETGS